MRETTALGAAYAAGLACGYYEDLEEVADNAQVDRAWKPQMDEALRERIYAQWKKAVTRSFDWMDE
jgi:glycerol kinase